MSAKLFFMSDIHGSLYWLKKAIAKYEEEKADGIIILGDELYHGPRNPLPKEYNPKEVAELLNGYAAKITAVRGNCDSEVDSMVIRYPIMADYAILYENGKRLFLTHGHLFDENRLPPLAEGDAFFFGHIHVPKAYKKDGVTILNPGSISLPKEDTPHCYGVLENGTFTVKDLEGGVYKQIEL